jgi:phosphatidylglycerol lysyltransferase
VTQTDPPALGAATLAGADLGEWWARLRPWLLAAVGLVLTALLGVALRRLLTEVHYAGVMAAMDDTPAPRIWAAVLATGFSYLALTRYDASALRYVGAKVGEPTVLLTSFVAYALSNTIGLGPLSGGVVRMRLYSAAGVEPPQIARVIVFNAVAFGLGMVFFGAVGLLWGAHDVATLIHVPGWVLRLVAAAMLILLIGFVWLCVRRRSIGIGRLGTLQLPPAGLALRQLGISAVELAASATVLWLLLPAGHMPLAAFVAFYAIAITAGIVTHIPGGVGVFETVMLLGAGHGVQRDAMLGALLLNRGIYYLLPLVVAAGLLILYELRSGVVAPVGRMAVRLSPSLMAALTLIAGVWLIVSGATPFTADAREVSRCTSRCRWSRPRTSWAASPGWAWCWSRAGCCTGSTSPGGSPSRWPSSRRCWPCPRASRCTRPNSCSRSRRCWRSRGASSTAARRCCRSTWSPSGSSPSPA